MASAAAAGASPRFHPVFGLAVVGHIPDAARAATEAKGENPPALPGLALLTVPPDLVQRVTQLLRRRPVLGRQVFDLQLVATVLGNGGRRISTFNTKDFEPFQELEVIVATLP